MMPIVVAALAGAAWAGDRPETVVREVVRGTWVEAGIGTDGFLGLDGVGRPCGTSECALLSGQMAMALGVGNDFVDRERFGLTWELRAGEALFNGPTTDDLKTMHDVLGENSPVEGDMVLISGAGSIAAYAYPSRRVGLGVRAGGGVGWSPKLMGSDGYKREVLDRFGDDPLLQQGALPIALGGASLRYYTKLAHFSVGVDVDAAYLVGFDLAVNPRAALRYTF